MEQIAIKLPQVNGSFKSTVLVKIGAEFRIADTARYRIFETKYLQKQIELVQECITMCYLVEPVNYEHIAKLMIEEECIIWEMKFRGLKPKTDEDLIREAGY